MKYLFLILTFITVFLSASQAQTTNTYLTDITQLRNLLQHTPSYKDQIKNERLDAYNALFEKLANDTVSNVSDYRYFYNLARLFFPLRDNHLGMYQNINDDDFKDQPAYEKYIATKAFKDFPKYDINIDSLKDALSNKPQDAIEGIYYLDTMLSVGLFKTSDKEYLGVVLSSKIKVWRNPNWEKGQIAIHLYEDLPGYFKAIYADPVSKRLILFLNEKFRNLSLINSHFPGFFYEHNYIKTTGQKSFTNLPRNSYDFHFKNIAPGIQYLHIRHFSSNTADIKRSNSFYDSIKNLLTEPHLIVDLRNNEGGAIKVSKKYLALIARYVKRGHVYVLVNNGTASQGEIFTLQLKQLVNVQVLGQTTYGSLMYGSNYGNTQSLPSKGFQVYLTDMEGEERLMPYEVYGIDPDTILADSKDWIDQTVEIIRKK